MGYTNELQLGWGAMAEQIGLKVNKNGFYTYYEIPDIWENGWIMEVNPAKGLHVSSAWFTAKEPLEYTMHIKEPCLWIFCIDQGSLTFTQRGKSTRTLSPSTQIYISNGKPIHLSIDAKVHSCFTCLLVFDSWIEKFLLANAISYPIRISDAQQWLPLHVDTPLAMLVMEQLRWGVRGNRLPPPAYPLKAGELLCLFAHSFSNHHQKRQRRLYVTWENEQKLDKIRELIDKDPIHVPATETLCQLAQMSESKLRIAFKSLYGKPLYTYIREAVMKLAMQLLAYDEMSIKNIAAHCGYENPGKFTAAFKDVHGITPSAFRKGFGL